MGEPEFEPIHDPPSRASGEHHLVVRHEGKVVVVEDAAGVSLPSFERVAHVLTTEALVIGREQSRHWWAGEAIELGDLPESARLVDLRSLHGRVPDTHWNIAGRATQLLDWQRDHAHCGRCGAPTERAAGERALRCPVDGLTVYPRLSPAVIVLIERDDGRALLARSGRWDIPMFSTLAGFVEPGESLEDTVHREIREEVGVEVTDVRYVSSQPWPFPNSLMLGFTSRWAGGEVVVDGDEIAEARWFHHDDLPMIPPPMSIARELIDGWIARQRG